uniref:Uncharacterized protein n=1 Tax=Nothobranchius furzeri TaxID=105023 RepID=A0A8C6L535_NOTFU
MCVLVWEVTYPEVIRIHMELLRVHHTQLGVGVLDVVHVLHSRLQSTHHCLSMVGHFGVSEDGGGGGEVSKGPKVSLTDWVPGQSLGSDLTHIDVRPQGGDGAALGICPLDHVDGVKVSFDFSQICSLIKDLGVKRINEVSIYSLLGEPSL